MANNSQTKKNDVEVRFSSKWLATSRSQRIECDMHDTSVHQLYICIAKARGVEVTRQELHKPVMGSNDVVDVLLFFRQVRLISRGELLFTVEWIRMP